MVARSEIIREARTHLHVPWSHQGRVPGVALDCVGLVVLVLDHFNLFPDDGWKYVQYPRRPTAEFLSYFRRYGKAKSPASALDGDVLVFNEGNHPCHCGFRTTYLGQPGIIHAHAGMRKVVEQELASSRGTLGRPQFCFAFPGVGE